MTSENVLAENVETASQLDVLIVLGTRPEALKLAPLIPKLGERGLTVATLSTGQHPELLGAHIPGNFLSLGIASRDSVPRFLSDARKALRHALSDLKPRCVLVQGDTMSAAAGALAARGLDIPVAHVEAGVRSHDRGDPWPEETLRVEIDQIATWRYAPTARALANLRHERLDGVLTGNTGTDALHGLSAYGPAGHVILVTLHRRELRLGNDVGAVLEAIFTAAIAMPGVRFVWPVHPAMRALVMETAERFPPPPNLDLRVPISHDLCLTLLAGARGVLTDSGGLTEEAATLGVPVAIVRAANDRPEAVDVGIARQFAPTARGVHEGIAMLVKDELPRVATDVFGDGHASERIALHLAEALQAV